MNKIYGQLPLVIIGMFIFSSPTMGSSIFNSFFGDNTSKGSAASITHKIFADPLKKKRDAKVTVANIKLVSVASNSQSVSKVTAPISSVREEDAINWTDPDDLGRYFSVSERKIDWDNIKDIFCVVYQLPLEESSVHLHRVDTIAEFGKDKPYLFFNINSGCIKPEAILPILRDLEDFEFDINLTFATLSNEFSIDAFEGYVANVKDTTSIFLNLSFPSRLWDVWGIKHTKASFIERRGNLDKVKINDLIRLNSFANYQQILSLNLSLNDLDDDCAKCISNIRRLKALYLCHNEITSTGVRYFSVLTDLRILTLNYNLICIDDNLDDLKSLTNLRYLILSAGHLTFSLVELQDALPNCFMVPSPKKKIIDNDSSSESMMSELN